MSTHAEIIKTMHPSDSVWVVKDRRLSLAQVPMTKESSDVRYEQESDGSWCRAEKSEADPTIEAKSRAIRVRDWLVKCGGPKTPSILQALTDPVRTEPLSYIVDALRWRRSQTSWLYAREGRRSSEDLMICPPLLQVYGGSTGMGKTVALIYAAGANGGLFDNASRIATTLRNGFSVSEEAWELWLKVPVLCIDECGMERTRSEVIGDLIVERWNNGLATFCAGNLERSEFATRYFSEMAARIQDRIQNEQPNSIPWFVNCTGASLRTRRKSSVEA